MADQRYYVSDTSAFGAVTGWRPRVPLGAGLESLYTWLAERHAPARATAALR